MNLTEINSPDWGRIPPLTVTGAARLENSVMVVPTDHGDLRVTLHECGARLRLGGAPVRDYGMLSSEPAALPLVLDQGAGETRLSGGPFTLTFGHTPLSMRLERDGKLVQSSPTDGHFVRQHRLPPFARLDDGWFVAFDLVADAGVYGLGEKWERLDRRGQLLRSWNHDALGVNAEASYKNTPFAWSPDGWGLFVHTPSPVTHAIGHAPWSHRAYGLVVQDDSLDLFLFAGKDGAAIIGHYTALTGRTPVPPLWSLGVILSRAYYRTAEEILQVAKEVRARGMPCDTITFDGRAWQDTATRFRFEFDPARYPDPHLVIDALKALNFHICVWEYPLVSAAGPLFDDMAAKGWLLKDQTTGEALLYHWDPEPFGAVLTPLPPSGLVDFTNPDAYAFWRDQHRALFELGVDMIKADFGEQVGENAVAWNGASGRELHNVYALLYNRCVYEAAERYASDGAFLFSRAGWTGAQRYPSQWGGDPQSDWGGLAASVRGALSWGLSGGPYFATDVGGFYGDQRDPILYLRWLQAAVFSAHLRLHGIGAREPWSYDEVSAEATEALALRYRLLPYLLNAMNESAATGLPVQRAMVLAFPDERAAWAFEHQFMFGNDLLVAPCLRADGRVQCYLPSGDWRRFPSGERTSGGRCLELTLTLNEMAVFARAGALIPLAPVSQYVGRSVGESVGGSVGQSGAEPDVEEFWGS